MIKSLFYICIFLIADFASAQKTLLIARNTSTKTMHDGKIIKTFGFAQRLSENPGVPGPPLVYYEGDSVTIDLWNVSQHSPHTIHLHGLDVDQANDGVPGLSFTVEHMEHGYYKFKAPHPGTYLYHCHVVSSIHVQAGMYGLLVIKPKGLDGETWKNGYGFSRDYNFLLSEIDTVWHKSRVLDHSDNHDSIVIPEYNPQYFLCNGASDSQMNLGDSIEFVEESTAYLRFANIGNHGNQIVFPEALDVQLISSDGRPLPTKMEVDTLRMYPGERYGVLVHSFGVSFDTIRMNYVDLNNGRLLSTNRIAYKAVKVGSSANVKNEIVQVYPNPTNGQIQINAHSTIRSIEVFNLFGIRQDFQVASSDQTQISIPPSAENGIYFLKIRMSNGNQLIQKFVLQR